MKPAAALRSIKVLHTIVWVLFVGCILGIPILGYIGSFAVAAVLFGVVFLEVIILVINGMRCPLTGVAARFTDDRRDNFDIYLPEWIARYNKLIFGPLYFLGSLYALGRWADWF